MDVSPFPSVDLFNTLLSQKQELPENEGQQLKQPNALDNLSEKHNTLNISASERFSSAENFSLTLKTREGDNVTINFSNQASFQASLASTKNPNSNAAIVSLQTVSLQTSSSSSFRFSVEGNLNEDEQTAINSLVKELSSIADKFFSGDVQAAFNSAADLKLDGSQLASLDFRLSQNQSYSRTATYESIQQLSAPAQATKALQPLREGLQEQIGNAQQVIQDASDITRSLLNNLIEQDNRYSQANSELQQQLDKNLAALNSLINNLGSQSDNPNQET